MAGVEVRLSPEGEILIKSPGQFSGYYKQPELTAESFTDDGFFRTGDRGELRADGMLKITGRTKELFKTAKGKYVAPALGVRQVLRTRVAISAIRVAKLCAGCSSSSCFVAALCCADAERLAGATGSRVALAA